MIDKNRKICIIGGGISGLTAAFLLKKNGFDVTLFEKTNFVGGNIQSVRIDDYLIEYAPNSLLKSPRLVDLIKELKLETEVLAADAENTKRYVLQDGKLESLPMSIAGMATNDFFSWKARLRLLREPFVRTRSPENESVAEFFERRLGREIVDKAADPFISGIYAGNPANLSIKAAFPRLYELEKLYRSLLIGSLLSKAEKPDKDFPRTFSFKDGVQTLTGRLAAELGENVQANADVKGIEKTADGRFLVGTEQTQDAGKMPAFRQEDFDALIISTPAASAAKLIENIDANLSEQLNGVYYPPVAMVFFGVEKESIPENLDGFGFLVPSSENRKILGTIWNSSVFPDRAPDGCHLLTTFVGGTRNTALLENSDEELFQIVYSELNDILGLNEIPAFRHIKRWPKAIPQYELGYDKIEKAIEGFENENPGIFFCSNFHKGISVCDCVKNSYAVTDRISNFLDN
ncbi:MAG: protoporphyrinogen oxidase [Saprospiraceae bacterium]|nr:protoporphyrinogen oxidase [Pyrinomonadaceae bacterium]